MLTAIELSCCREKVAETGTIECRICGETFQCRISYLSDPVDVYCEWIDACEAARDGSGAVGAGGGGAGAGAAGDEDS
jgi:transcription elongation factor Elf1